MAREFLMIVQENTYNAPPATAPVLWTTASPYDTYAVGTTPASTGYYIRLDEGNAFTMRARPQEVEIAYGGGLAIGAYRASDKTELRGNLRCKLTTALAPFLLSWAATRIDTTQTNPWTTTIPAGDLASCSIYHAIMRSDGTFRRRLYKGCKVDSWTLDISSDSQVGTLNLAISGSTPQGNVYDGSADPDSSMFPAPATQHLPRDPYLFSHTATGVFINNVIRRNLSQLTLTATNTLARNFFNQRYLGVLEFTGRDVSAAVRLQYVATPDDRVTYEGTMPYGVTPIPVNITLNDGTHSMEIQLNTNNVIDPLDEDLPLDDLYFQSSTHNNLWDPAVDTDFGFLFT
jgi:hypothetical protein